MFNNFIRSLFLVSLQIYLFYSMYTKYKLSLYLVRLHFKNLGNKKSAYALDLLFCILFH